MNLTETAAPPAAADAQPTLPLMERLERDLREGRISLPVLPRVAGEIQELIRQDAGPNAFASVISREPAIATALLKYANAAMYTGLREVTDLQHAITRLGLGAVQNAVIALSAKGAFGGGEAQYRGLYERIWQHSITTAGAARRLARMVAVQPDTAFLAGLIHDVGKIVVLRGITAARHSDPRFIVPEHTIGEFLDALHTTMGDVLCETWNIPAELRDVVRRHHDPEVAGAKDRLRAVVQIANLMAAKVGASLRPDPSITLLDKPASALLQLDDVKIAALLIDLEDDREQLSAL